MKTATLANRSIVLAGITATLAVAALSFAGSAQARDNVLWSVGVGAPGVSLNVGNAGPVYVPIYVQPEQVYYGRPYGWNRRHGGRYVQAARPGYGAGYYDQRYAPVSQVVYQREGWGDGRHDGRRDGGHDNRR